MKPVRVIWFDAAVYPGWCEKQGLELEGPVRVETLGWMIELKEDSITLAMSMSEKTVSELLVIPRSTIEAIEYF